jgi:hypothetical protein
MAFEVAPMAYQYFRSGFVFMSNEGNGSLYLYGETLAKQQVSKVEVTIYVQQLRNGTWVNIWSDSASRLGASSVNIDRIVIVPGGYYYRLHGEHIVNHLGVIEKDYSYTGSTYVN